MFTLIAWRSRGKGEECKAEMRRKERRRWVKKGKEEYLESEKRYRDGGMGGADTALREGDNMALSLLNLFWAYYTLDHMLLFQIYDF